MDYREKVNELLEGVSRHLGLVLKFDEGETICRFRDNNSQRRYALEVLEKHDMLYIYCPLMEVPTDNREAFFRFLLTLNLHGLQTQHAFVGLDAVKNLIVMSYSFPVDLLDEILLYNIITNFTASAEKVYQSIDNYLRSNSYGKAIGRSHPHDMAKMSKLRVRI